MIPLSKVLYSIVIPNRERCAVLQIGLALIKYLVVEKLPKAWRTESER
jgi:hypothetical protein